MSGQTEDDRREMEVLRKNRRASELVRELGIEYPYALPAEIPAGRVLVHNHVRPTRRLGSRGFRAWLQRPDSGPPLAVCDCDWAPELGTHYRVVRVEADAVS